jgi:hypothetical protein
MPIRSIKSLPSLCHRSGDVIEVPLIRCRDQAKAGPADAYLDGGATIGPRSRNRPGDGRDVTCRVDQQILSR